jgi:TIR domain
MRRIRELQIKMLKHLRGDEVDYALDTHSETEKIYNAALLVEEGLVKGTTRRNHLGGYSYASMQGLTPAGHDFLDKLDSDITKPLDVGSVENQVAIFISHSSSDEKLANQLAKLFQLAFSLSPDQIRCTSVNGYRLPAGADTNAQLRTEVRNSRVLVGIITGASMGSTYVLFELGARWGARLPLFPVLGDTVGHTLLRGPLSGINALDLKDQSQVSQLLEDIGGKLELKVHPFHTIVEDIKKVVLAATEKKKHAPLFAGKDMESKIQSEDPVGYVLRALALLGEEAYSIYEIIQNADMPIVKVRSHLQNLVSLGYVESILVRGNLMYKLTQHGCEIAANSLL